jgi:hypothetical protein
MDDSHPVTRVAWLIADAIAGRDTGTLESLLAPGFLHRTPAGKTQDAVSFLEAIRDIPGDIIFVKLESLEIDLTDAGALVTGVQHARVRTDGVVIDDRSSFVDWFVQHDGAWRIRVAVTLPTTAEATASAASG